MKPDELTGQPVYIGSEGRTGIILDNDINDGGIRVDFLMGGHGRYQLDDLYILKPYNDIYDNVETNKAILTREDYQALLQIALLECYGETVPNIMATLSMAGKSEIVMNLSLLSLKIALSQDRRTYFER